MNTCSSPFLVIKITNNKEKAGLQSLFLIGLDSDLEFHEGRSPHLLKSLASCLWWAIFAELTQRDFVGAIL
jgi:hypothetical protein